MSTVSLRDIVEAKTGTRNPTALPDESFTYVDVASVDNNVKAIFGARSLLGLEAPSRARKVIRQGDILVSTIRPNLNAVALVPADLDGQIASTGFCVLRPTDHVLSEYLFYFVQSQSFVSSLCTLVAGAMYPAVSDSQVLDQRIPFPELVEQRRIVDLLSRAEGIVRLRRDAQKKAAELIPAIFVEMFGDPATNPKGWPTLPLNEVSKVISGVAKGRQLSGDDLIELPYMRVGNVKDGHLDLNEVKTMEIKRSEVEKLRIEPGDLLMTEGGDPDKLGRAALWCGEIDLCVHQNHIFKVRSNRALLLPEYLRSLASSAYGKAYFLRVAKKTTGIASINKTQLSAFPVVLPPLDLQKKLVRQRNLWVVFEVLRRMLLEWGCIVELARRGQATCPQDEPVDSRYAVRGLTTAPRLGAFGLTRWRLPTAIELEITLNSQCTNTSPMAIVAYF